MTMRRYSVLFLVGYLCVSLTACVSTSGKRGGTQSPETPEVAKSTTIEQLVAEKKAVVIGEISGTRVDQGGLFGDRKRKLNVFLTFQNTSNRGRDFRLQKLVPQKIFAGLYEFSKGRTVDFRPGDVVYVGSYEVTKLTERSLIKLARNSVTQVERHDIEKAGKHLASVYPNLSQHLKSNYLFSQANKPN